MNDITTLLGIKDTGRLAEFLLYRMSMDTRHKLMAEMPTVYAKLYPNVSPELLANHVAARIRQDRSEVAANRAYERGLITDDERKRSQAAYLQTARDQYAMHDGITERATLTAAYERGLITDDERHYQRYGSLPATD